MTNKPPAYAEPAHSILEALGGYQAVARRLGVSHTTVYRWQREPTARQYGSGGFIPREYHEPLIRMAAELSLLLQRPDFLAETPVTIAALKARWSRRDRVAS